MRDVTARVYSRVMEEIGVGRGVTVPGCAMSYRSVRSSGPGGQNVNKVASKVELRVELDEIRGLTGPAHTRLVALAARRLDSRGRLLVTSQRTRDKFRNLQDCREKVRTLVAKAVVPPRRRRATQPTAAARQRRLDAKHRWAEKKKARGRVRAADLE